MVDVVEGFVRDNHLHLALIIKESFGILCPHTQHFSVIVEAESIDFIRIILCFSIDFVHAVYFGICGIISNS